MTPGPRGPAAGGAAEQEVAVTLQSFAREALLLECERLGVSEEELIRFAVMYYLADLDSGRIARRIVDGSSPMRSPDGP